MIIPDGTAVRVINKELGTYGKIITVCYSFNSGYMCHNSQGYLIAYSYRDFELETLNNGPICNFKNSRCYFCGTINKHFIIKNRIFYYCLKCLR